MQTQIVKLNFKKETMNFKSKQGWVYKRTWRRERGEIIFLYYKMEQL